MQMKFATVSALLLFFVAAAPAAPDARNGLKIPLTFIKENGVVDLETLRSRHARIQAYVDLLATIPHHHQLTLHSNLDDLTDYINFPPSVSAPSGFQAPPGVDVNYMDSSVLDVFKFNAGTDVTKQLDNLNIDKDVLARQKTCLRNLFTIGKEDHRNAPQCLFATYILLALSIVMVSIIGFKFLAALSFGTARAPEDHDKFVICQVPCYTEGEESMRKTIDSLAKLKYDDKRKLIFIICDGMIVGSGNDRPTPRIVLDILGADPNNDPEPLSFLSLGEGAKQHNMGKVYSGLYECAGHVVPYIVVVKVGKPTERSRPGNRGKRDSQMLLMHFLNKVCINSFSARCSYSPLALGSLQCPHESARA